MNARAGQHAQGAVTSLAVLGLLSNALVWGLSWWPFKHLQAQGLHPLWATSLVYALSFAALLLWVWLRGQRLRQDFAHPGLWCLLLAAGMTNVGFNWAVTIGDVVRVVLLFYLMPAWTVLLAWGLLGERPTRAALLRLALALLGLWVVLHTPQQPWPLPRSLADALALLGGFSFALANVLLLKLKHTRESSRMLAIFGGDTFMAAAVAALVGASAPSLPALASNAALLWLLLGLALAVLLGNLGLLYGAARLPAQTTALVMLSEVVVASVSSVVLGAGQWELRTAVGGGLILLAALLSVLKGKSMPSMQLSKQLSDFEANTLDGQRLPLSRCSGQVLLIVNTASACGFTPQLAGLEQLHQRYAAQGLQVLGFPCNQFAQQEPGDAAQIASFCQRNYGVSFQMMDKVQVKGPAAHPLFAWLSAQAPGVLGSRSIKWNFTKFLLGRDGRVIRRYAPFTPPARIARDIEAALKR